MALGTAQESTEATQLSTTASTTPTTTVHTTPTTTPTTTAHTTPTTTPTTTAHTTPTTTHTTTAHTTPTTTPTTTPHTTPTTTPTTTAHTTPATTNTTTAHTNATTAPPTTHVTNSTASPTPAPTTPAPTPNPDVGEYNVKSDGNSTECLKAKMGLQFRFKPSVNASLQTINLNPNTTSSNGTCGSNGSDATLQLTSDTVTVLFVFTTESGKFHLQSLSFSALIGSGSKFKVDKTNLTLWEATLGSSYMCRKEQSYNLTDAFTLNTFDLQVQPYEVTSNKFNKAVDCQADVDNYIVPIAVGVALGVLILIVILAYVIGRKRNQFAGYESFS
ncbi:lysosome-associated membrane glycoprotein 2 [Chanos chanos]|uniref:Lysosome-associated membrane glycoprotein 2 n=1 Tax=Chanos chanos TaxID=29144 RepID=A0A6J2UM44_CHACN|nr:lysosome-associated membrane glycoprotein 2 [Chanos chanos]